jgi:hypothetical protein
MAGKKGRSGRKGAGREFADFKKLWETWTDPKAMQDIEAKEAAHIRLSLEEQFLLRAFRGTKERDLAIFKKLYPDTNRLEGPEGGPLIVTWEK